MRFDTQEDQDFYIRHCVQSGAWEHPGVRTTHCAARTWEWPLTCSHR